MLQNKKTYSTLFGGGFVTHYVDGLFPAAVLFFDVWALKVARVVCGASEAEWKPGTLKAWNLETLLCLAKLVPAGSVVFCKFWSFRWFPIIWFIHKNLKEMDFKLGDGHPGSREDKNICGWLNRPWGSSSGSIREFDGAAPTRLWATLDRPPRHHGLQFVIFDIFLVGGLEDVFFPYIGNNHPNWLSFFRGVQTTNQI